MEAIQAQLEAKVSEGEEQVVLLKKELAASEAKLNELSQSVSKEAQTARSLESKLT